MLQDRKYQDDLRARCHVNGWNQGAQNVLMRLDTGGGKTKIFCDETRESDGGVCLIAHRNEIVAGISDTLARNEIRHDIVASAANRKGIAKGHVEQFGTCYYTPGARVKVVSIDTFLTASGLDTWLPQVKLWIPDEAHHVVVGNKWHAAYERFTNPQLRGLFPTATPKRADGKGLGRHADGLADVMFEGPPMRWLIEQQFLTEYDVICPPSDMQVLKDVAASGDWSPSALKEASKASHITGDVVHHYLRAAAGRLGVTFMTDVETATETTQRFRDAGVPAELLTGSTDPYVRRDILRRYKAREILQLVTVDIVSEGFDLPAIEVASMARPTQSLALYMQQFGRALRPMPGKSRALIIDHVGNIVRHEGPPDKPRVWTLDRRDKRASTAAPGIPLRTCRNEGCYKPYPATSRACTHCGWAPEPAGRSSPAQVEGDLQLLDPAVLAALRGQVLDVDQAPEAYRNEQQRKGARPEWLNKHVKARTDAQAAQIMLRAAMGRWGGLAQAAGLDDAGIQRAWFFVMGVDVLTAQGLSAKETWDLLDRCERQPFTRSMLATSVFGM